MDIYRMMLPEPIKPFYCSGGDFADEPTTKFVEMDTRFYISDAQNVNELDHHVCKYEHKHHELPKLLLLGKEMYLSLLRHINNDRKDGFEPDKDVWKGVVKFQFVPTFDDNAYRRL